MKRTLTQVLIVDDDAIIALDMRRLLQDVSVAATLISSGEKAWEIIQQQPFDLILLNLHLPGLSGLEVCRRLKADPKLKAIPVIFVSGETDRAVKSEALRLGAVDFLGKPFNPALFKARVLAYLRPPPRQKVNGIPLIRTVARCFRWVLHPQPWGSHSPFQDARRPNRLFLRLPDAPRRASLWL